MIINDFQIDIDDIIGHSEYSVSHFVQDVSSNNLLKICIGESSYVLKIFKNSYLFENELYFMYLMNKNKLKVPGLVKYGSSDTQSWLMYKYVEGFSLNQIKNQLSLKTLKQVWKQVGKELKKTHSISLLNEINATKNISNFFGQIERKIAFFNNYIVENDNSPILVDAVHFLKNNFPVIQRSANLGVVLFDFNEKHIIIKQRKGKWTLNAFIDFEQACLGCLYVDIAQLFICTLLDNKELEKCFWTGYKTEDSIFDELCICFFITYFGLLMCTVLRNLHVHHYQFGLSIIQKAFGRNQKNNFSFNTLKQIKANPK
jgi:hypothetical protein